MTCKTMDSIIFGSKSALSKMYLRLAVMTLILLGVLLVSGGCGDDENGGIQTPNQGSIPADPVN